MSLEGFRFGAGIGFSGTPTVSGPGVVWALPIEAFAGYAFGRARPGLQPYVELRASAAHVFSPREGEIPSVWAFSLVQRAGVRVLLSQYFFFDFGVGVGIGAERAQIMWALGLPIPTANL